MQSGAGLHHGWSPSLLGLSLYLRADRPPILPPGTTPGPGGGACRPAGDGCCGACLTSGHIEFWIGTGRCSLRSASFSSGRPTLRGCGTWRDGSAARFDHLVKATRIGPRPGARLTTWSTDGEGARWPVGSVPPARRERRGPANARSRGREDVARITWAGGRDTKSRRDTPSSEACSAVEHVLSRNKRCSVVHCRAEESKF